MSTDRLECVDEILRKALIEIRKKHGISVTESRVEWLGTMERPDIDIGRIEINGNTWGVIDDNQN